ncbi:hypothetical protein CLV51_104356 [Chitinophaga niastensis]|uniref:Methyltransferase family protein n=2 Tax=Chitinophaga niastensis TaxID=536980 RepID=A0A2P8HHJ1_CHINA|nr:hypothetical protein CLV51_104356 [Chitinophaga niastensis]
MMHINYGIDGPKFVRNLFLFSFLFFGIAIIIARIEKVAFSIVLAGGFICLAEGLLMLLYAKKGKFNHRDRMLNLVHWTGDERVLDVGTGLGLLMIGAAKKLTGGKATGIDIWNKDDLSENSSGKAYMNSEKPLKIRHIVASMLNMKNTEIGHTHDSAGSSWHVGHDGYYFYNG